MATSSGRPKVFVDRDKLEFLRSVHFTWEEISAILGVSVKTLQRRAKEWSIRTYCTITDSMLDGIISRTLHDFPRAGEAMMRGYLLSIDVHVQRHRIRQSVYRVTGTDPSPLSRICRRTYSVPGSNYLWHVDGNHKMIKWRLVIHGGIDGFSRLITYLHCSNNNRADTVTEQFIGATCQYGVPSRVRSDHGTENVGVWRFMEEIRGSRRNSYIAGRSVHNTRIERLWRDVYTSVSSTYVQIFHEIEQESILDADNDSDLFCLHYIFLPRINSSLKTFKFAWNNHPLSTEGNRSPLQLYTGGSIGNPLFDEEIDLETYGIDQEAPLLDEVEEEATVLVSDTQCDIGLSEESLRNLQARVNPVQQCTDFGVQLYKDTVQIVYQLLMQ